MGKVSYLNIQPVIDSANNYLQTAQGKAAVRSAGGIGIDFNRAIAYAQELKKMLIAFADTEFSTSQLSIYQHINNIEIGSPIDNGDGTCTIELNLGGDLSRPSLNPQKEVDNIVSLFIHGWTIKKKRPFGMWHGMYVGAKESRPGLGFASNAIEQFNAQYSSIGVSAKLGGGYS